MIRIWLRKWLGLEDLKYEVDMIKDALEKKRVLKWIRLVKYEKGMSLNDTRPDPISLEKLQADIARIDSHLRGIRSDRRFKTKKRNDWRV